MAKNWTTLLKAATGYLQGKIEDGETLVGEELNNDIVQYFVKLMDLAGITPSGDYDNETNGYELIDALVAKIRATTATTTLKGTVEKATAAEVLAGAADKFPDSALLQGYTYAASPTLLNGWSENAGGIAYGSDKLGRKFLVIDSLDGTSATADTICLLDSFLGGSRRRFLTGATDSYGSVILQIDASGNLKTNSRQDFICGAWWLTP